MMKDTDSLPDQLSTCIA